jgi:hypothetical protein
MLLEKKCNKHKVNNGGNEGQKDLKYKQKKSVE